MSRWGGAQWRPIGCNHSPGTDEPNRLLVCHVIQGSLQAADSWFRNPAAQASAHFGIGTAGTCLQWIDTDDMSWAQCNGNGYSISVETAGYAGQPWTGAQVTRLGQLLHWCNQQYPEIRLWLNTDPVNGRGLSYHGLGGDYFCGHYGCPGSPRVAQLHDVLDVAKAC
jgi:N-acetylmuramoyl-L-alanine amidase